jgi:hypothetical protein
MRKLALIAAVATATSATSAIAGPTVLTFEGVGNLASVNNFYNGGTDSNGNSGPNYGISFSSNSLGLVDADAGGSGNTANEPSPETTLVFLTGDSAVMNVAAGFDTGFSFYYSAPFYTGSVNVYDGLDGTGNVLATLNLALTGTDCPGDPNGQYACWSPVGVTFNGTAHSVGFGGTENYIVFDNITLGSAIPGTGSVPEPSTWAMMLLGFGGFGLAFRKSRRTSLAAASAGA